MIELGRRPQGINEVETSKLLGKTATIVAVDESGHDVAINHIMLQGETPESIIAGRDNTYAVTISGSSKNGSPVHEGTIFTGKALILSVEQATKCGFSEAGTYNRTSSDVIIVFGFPNNERRVRAFGQNDRLVPNKQGIIK